MTRSAGYSLVEILVVVAIIGFLAVVGIGELNKFSRREELASNANQVSGLLQQAAITLRTRDAVTFVKIGPVYSTTIREEARVVRDFQLVADTCCGAGGLTVPNGVFDDPTLGATGDTVVQTLTVPVDRISLSTTAIQPAIEQANWSAGTVADTWVVGVNFRGQTISRTGVPVGGAVLLSMTHADMIAGSLRPLIAFQHRINPVWEVQLRRTVDGKTY
jgi:prepilin-type N-terminal cleavage/methylation domain-containing protein